MAMGKWLGPALDALAGPGGYVLANQPLDVARWQRLPDPPGVPKDRYFLYRGALDSLTFPRHTGEAGRGGHRRCRSDETRSPAPPPPP